MKTRKPYGYWKNKENCREEALKFSTISEFAKNHMSPYNFINKMGWGVELFSHMKKYGNWYNRCVYSFEFDDNSVYIGITYNINKRKKEHLKLSGKKITSVGKHIIKTGLSPILNVLTDYIDVEEAKILENKFVIEYKKGGCTILNSSKTGGIGGKPIIWNIENCYNEALKYTNRTDFRVKSNGAYDAAYRKGWLNDVCKHMKVLINPKNYWSFEKCCVSANNYKTRTEFARKCSAGYDAAHRNGWLNDVCKHMKTKLRNENQNIIS